MGIGRVVEAERGRDVGELAWGAGVVESLGRGKKKDRGFREGCRTLRYMLRERKARLA